MTYDWEHYIPDTLPQNIGRTLLIIHRCISRAIQVSIEHSRTSCGTGYPHSASCKGFTCYVHSLITVLDAHRLTEDEVAFPSLKNALPEVPYELLSIQHRQMVPMLGEIRLHIDNAADISSGPESLQKLHRVLVGLADRWQPHIQVEETYFTPRRVEQILSPEEQTTLAMRFAEHNRTASSPDYWIVHFTLYNLAPEDRAAMAMELPPILTEQMVPVVWKEKWQSMMPFLLG